MYINFIEFVCVSRARACVYVHTHTHSICSFIYSNIITTGAKTIVLYLLSTGLMVANPEISWVLDITIAYPQGKPLDLPTIITGSRPPCETVLFYRLFPSSVVSDVT